MNNMFQEIIGSALGLKLRALAHIKENAYCNIYRAEAENQPFIIKKYKGEDSKLARMEARALEFYHRVADGDEAIISSKTVKLVAEENLLCIGFVEGEPLNDFLYRARNDHEARLRALHVMEILGDFLRRLYEMTGSPGAETDPFIFEYMAYTSARLETTPLLGRLFFSGMIEDAARLSNLLRSSDLVPSFSHGDFVFRNIHVAGNRVGLIDFANTNPRSHTLNDAYNLRLALANMMLPYSFKRDLRAAFRRGLGDLTFPDMAHRFYYEYNRRRWLMLKIRTKSPATWTEATRGLLGFALPYSPEMIK